MDIEHYIEHRMFQGILVDSGVNEHERQIKVVNNWIAFMNTRSGGMYPGPLAEQYLHDKIYDDSSAQILANYVIARGWGIALVLADELEASINKADPKTQKDAYDTVQTCLNLEFGLKTVHFDREFRCLSTTGEMPWAEQPFASALKAAFR